MNLFRLTHSCLRGRAALKKRILVRIFLRRKRPTEAQLCEIFQNLGKASTVFWECSRTSLQSGQHSLKSILAVPRIWKSQSSVSKFWYRRPITFRINENGWEIYDYLFAHNEKSMGNDYIVEIDEISDVVDYEHKEFLKLFPFPLSCCQISFQIEIQMHNKKIFEGFSYLNKCGILLVKVIHYNDYIENLLWNNLCISVCESVCACVYACVCVCVCVGGGGEPFY